MQRPDRDTYFMLMAKTAALRGTCSRRYVGAIAVDDEFRVTGSGYNGAPPGIAHCQHEDAEPCLVSEHAEWNTIVHGGARGHTLYCTDGACLRCAHLIVSAGFRRFVYCVPFRDASGVDRLASKLDQVTQWTCPPEWASLWNKLNEATSSYVRKA